MTSLVSHMTCFMVIPHPQCKSPTKNEPILSTISTSISSQDDYSFLCTKAERHLSLLFGDDIATVNVNHHYCIVFQNVSSLEISTEQHTLENTCDGIGSYEIDISYLAETNTHWKRPLGESTLRNTTKHH